jgi:hypothetical protein
VQGTISSGPAYGMSAGMSGNNAVLVVSAANSSASCYLGFTSTAQAYNHNCYFSFSNNTNQLALYTIQTGVCCVFDGSTANNTLIVGTTSSAGTTPYRLYVNGNSYFAGNTTATGTKTFDIVHPTKAGYRLRHRCIESPQARLMYEYTLTAVEGLNVLALPEWFSSLNSECTCYCSPARHFGQAWAEVVGAELQVTANCAGAFNVMVLGTRSDQVAVDEWAKYGVEYPDPAAP